MKVCPQCQNTYTDDSLQFCLQDGTPLNFQNITTDWTESETIVSSKNRQTGNAQTQPTQAWQQSPVTTNTSFQNPPPKSNKSKIILLVSLALLLFFSIVGVGIWILITNMRKEIAQINTNKGLNNQSSLPNTKPVNANTSTNVNTNWGTPTPKPTLKPEDAAKAKSAVADTINGWKSASESHDLNGHLGYYADTVDYYNAGKVNVGKVRKDREKAYNMYDSININISNVSTTIDDSGEKATSVFDKEWTFENDVKTNSGKVRQQLQFAKIGGEWRIIGEKDLKVY